MFEIQLEQKEEENPVSVKGAVDAVRDLYDVVRHDVLSINMRSVWFSYSFYWRQSHSFCSSSFQIWLTMALFSGKIMRHGICWQKQGLKDTYFQI